MTKLQENIILLRKTGKSYNEISKELNCSKGTIAYICSPEQKEKAKARCERHKTSKGVLYKKLQGFCYNYGKPSKTKKTVSLLNLDEVRDHLGKNPKCYLTGKSIDLNDMGSYSLDHKVPTSKGGKSTLENLGLLCSKVNRCKSDLMKDEFIEMCIEVLTHQGFSISKK